MSISFEWDKDSLYAHPGEVLPQHLLNVAARTKELVQQAEVPTWQGKLAYIAGFCHDLGKATLDFQDYLYCSAKGIKWQGKSQLKSHSKLGTQFCLAIGETWLQHAEMDEPEFTLHLWLTALAIRSHHGKLQDFIPDSFQINDLEFGEDYALICQQLDRLRRPQFDDLIGRLQLEVHIEAQEIIDKLLNKEKWRTWRKSMLRLDRILRNDEDLHAWAFLKLIYGCLLQADKEQNLKGIFERGTFPKEQVSKYADKFKVLRQIDQLRQKLFVQCTEYGKQIDLHNIRIHQLTLPTGSGKTLCGLQLASMFRHHIEEKGHKPRIIYALPFISIIEQNYKVFTDVFGTSAGELLMAHHHLANLDFEYKGEELDGVEAAFKIEGWESELIVTTFHQLFATIFSNANSANRRFAALQNAIIILDEPQALPVSFFKLIRQGLQTMIRSLGWQVILMTATPPLLFEKNDSACQQVVPNVKETFEQFNRYQLIDKRDTIHSIPELVNAVEHEWNSGARRILIVTNTISSSRRILEGLQKFPGKQAVELIYLSTEVLPIHRKEKIGRISDQKPVIVVSTQLIEAGVDVSLDVIFRDFAPLPSIIQSAGRCRRHDFQECKGRVIISYLHDENNRPYATKIYDPIMLDRTEAILKSGSESTFWPRIEAYYEEIQNAISQDTSKELIKHLSRLYLGKVDDEFALIDQLGKKRDLLILFDANAETLYREWQLLGSKIKEFRGNLEQIFKTRAERQKIWRQLARYLITPYEYRISKELLSLNKDKLIVIEKSDVKTYYSHDVGLIPLQSGQNYVSDSNIF